MKIIFQQEAGAVRNDHGVLVILVFVTWDLKTLLSKNVVMNYKLVVQQMKVSHYNTGKMLLFTFCQHWWYHVTWFECHITNVTINEVSVSVAGRAQRMVWPTFIVLWPEGTRSTRVGTVRLAGLAYLADAK